MTAAMPIRLALAGNNAIVLACLEQLFALEESELANTFVVYRWIDKKLSHGG